MGSKESIRKKSKKCSYNINSFCGNVPFYFNYFLYPLDTWRKGNVHKTFRNRPGRLLNILITFNLRPVSRRYSMGNAKVWKRLLKRSDVKDVILRFLLLLWTYFFTFFWCFYCWLWTSKYVSWEMSGHDVICTERINGNDKASFF